MAGYDAIYSLEYYKMRAITLFALICYVYSLFLICKSRTRDASIKVNFFFSLLFTISST